MFEELTETDKRPRSSYCLATMQDRQLLIDLLVDHNGYLILLSVYHA